MYCRMQPIEEERKDNLKHKTTAGFFWITTQRFSHILVSFVSGIVLARLLSPEDYGLIGMLSIFMLIAGTFIDGGFGFAIIQKKRPTQEDYSTVFFWNLGLAIVLYIVLYFCAPAIASFYHVPLLSKVLRVSGMVLIINALRAIHENMLNKQFQFKKLAITTIISSIISLALTIWMAYMGFGVWALVAQTLILQTIPMVVYWLTNKWIPKLVFSLKSFKELFSFGFYMLMNALMVTIVNNIQGLLIGRLYNPALMGYYSKAHSTETLASTTISQAVTQVTFPLYSELQDQMERLNAIIKRLTTTMAFICFPMLFILILLAKPLFVLLYSAKWLESVPYFQLLCIAGLAVSLASINTQPIAAIGKSKVMFYWGIVKQTVGIVFIVGGLILAGIWGMLVGMVVKSWVIYFINCYLVDKHIGYKLKNQLIDLLPVFIMSTMAFVIAYMFGHFFNLDMYLLAIVQFVMYLGIYCGATYVFKKDYFADAWDLIQPLLSKFKKK